MRDRREYSQRYYQKNKEKIKEQYQQNYEYSLLKAARKRAKKKNLECTITIDDIVIPERCPVLDVPLIRAAGAGCSSTPSIDRIDNDEGYTPSNIQVISNKANIMKSSATKEELERFARWVLKG
jgi:hypothetical protein